MICSTYMYMYSVSSVTHVCVLYNTVCRIDRHINLSESIPTLKTVNTIITVLLFIA